MTDDDWQGRLGHRNLWVNARTADEALRFVLEKASDLAFKTERLLDPGDDIPTSIAPPAEADRAAEPSGGGAWSVTILRLGHATPSGSEWDASYFTHAVEFLGARPHDRPHASGEPEHWRSVALAIDEQAALSISAAPSAPTPSKRRASL